MIKFTQDDVTLGRMLREAIAEQLSGNHVAVGVRVRAISLDGVAGPGELVLRVESRPLSAAEMPSPEAT